MQKRKAFILSIFLLFLLPLSSYLSAQESEVAPLGVMEEFQYQAKLNELEKIFELLQLNSNYLLLNSDLSLTDLEQMSQDLEMLRIRLIEIEESLTERLIQLTTVTSLLETTTSLLDEVTTLLESYVAKVKALEAENNKLKRQRNIAIGTSGGLAVVVTVLSLILAFGG